MQTKEGLLSSELSPFIPVEWQFAFIRFVTPPNSQTKPNNDIFESIWGESCESKELIVSSKSVLLSEKRNYYRFLQVIMAQRKEKGNTICGPKLGA
jgi:hypothetical protein